MNINIRLIDSDGSCFSSMSRIFPSFRKLNALARSSKFSYVMTIDIHPYDRLSSLEQFLFRSNKNIFEKRSSKEASGPFPRPARYISNNTNCLVMINDLSEHSTQQQRERGFNPSCYYSVGRKKWAMAIYILQKKGERKKKIDITTRRKTRDPQEMIPCTLGFSGSFHYILSNNSRHWNVDHQMLRRAKSCII